MQHTFSPRTYYLVFAALIALTAVTVGLAFLELGPSHLVTGLAIAITKAALVALFFMGVLRSGKLTWLVILSGLFWFGILMTLTLSDYLTRPWQSPASGQFDSRVNQ